MALRKREPSSRVEDKSERRDQARSLDALTKQLEQGDATVRRWAARDLAVYPTAAPLLCQHLEHETDLSVREAMLDSLMQLGNTAVVDGLLPMLRSADVALRNEIIELLQNMPAAVAPRMRGLLADQDENIRIYAIDVARALAHPEVPEMMRDLLARESHINVIGQAVECLAEAGTPEVLPVLEELKANHSTEPFIVFAVDTAISRITGC